MDPILAITTLTLTIILVYIIFRIFFLMFSEYFKLQERLKEIDKWNKQKKIK